ncbi:MAG: excinuclease ABC subunit UvrA [Fuerstiella sp.]|nr:excinuclease ABC subunit UvrA [Fuerstiella sp.]MCP4857990.1 excinuclease ABC subunit UvrA [Fuerstiella sp.]
MTSGKTSPSIRIRGARTHNLQNVSTDLPLGKLIVMTGVSGSGKSSLAFDTLFAEGQRRYLESVSVHTRTLLKQLPRPEVDEVSGLPPTVCVDQRATTAPARSTLAITTDIYDYLRLLYARAGTAHCTECRKPVESQSVDQIVERLLGLPERTKLMVLSPLVRARKGGHRDVFERISRNGFVRVRVDGELLDIADVPDLPAGKEHNVDAVIDRIIVKDGIDQRLRESVQLAVRESDGTCVVCQQVDGQWCDRFFSTKFSCPDCNLSFPSPEPRTFSFNSANGACPDCQGFGVTGVVDEIADVTVFRKAPCPACEGSRLQPFARGVTFLGESIADFTSLSVEDALARLRSWESSMPGQQPAVDVVAAVSAEQLSNEAALVAAKTLPDIQRRLECLQQAGIGYLTLNRPTRTLSGGEFQRARLAACLGTGLHGACFVLDEPTAGLHPRDTQNLLQTLFDIRDSGATVVVVEHDGLIMRAADYLVDLGPGAGVEGGRLLFSGSPTDAARTSDTPTGRYLRGDISGAFAASADQTDHTGEHTDRDRNPGSTQPTAAGLASQGQLFATEDTCPPAELTVRNARCNNLKNVTVNIPLGKMVCVTGVSGSGKSSLIVDTLLPIISAHLNRNADSALAAADANCDGVDGMEHLQRVVAVDNRPLSGTRRSCIATYSKLWIDVRKVFARSREARARGYAAGRFSFNSGDGRCVACKGTGLRDLQMSFLPDAVVSCPECGGRRFNRATLSIRFAEKNVADVLAMRVDEACEFFSEFAALRKLLETFQNVGLGYLTLGQPSATFSGGEAQRVRLATELAADRPEKTLYILDEPTSGLHPQDVLYLNTLLRNLVGSGHSVVVVEHNTDVMEASDWIIDVGPESALGGGAVVAQGPPAVIARTVQSLTAPFLVSGNSSHS